MTMLKKNRVTSLASLGKIEDQALSVVITSEMVASMPIEIVEEELREMGLAPDPSLPMLIRHMIDNGKDKSLRRISYYKYFRNKFYKRLMNVAFIPTLLIPKCLSDGSSLRKIIVGILMSTTKQLDLRVVATFVLAVALFYINLINKNDVLKRSSGHEEKIEIATSQPITSPDVSLASKSQINSPAAHSMRHGQRAYAGYNIAPKSQIGSNVKTLRDVRLSSEDI